MKRALYIVVAATLFLSLSQAAVAQQTTPDVPAQESTDDPEEEIIEAPPEPEYEPPAPPPVEEETPPDAPGVKRRRGGQRRFARSKGSEDPEHPVVIAEEGDYGMFFRFGGLATLLAGANDRTVNELIFSQVGWKLVLSRSLHVPLTFGIGLRRIKPDGIGSVSLDAETDWGFDVGGGIEYHFRIWRRISPFIGFNLGLGYTNPTGDSNSIFGLGLGPLMGVEYYIGDRVSLSALYFFTIQFERAFDVSTDIGIQTLAGGAMNLTYYF